MRIKRAMAVIALGLFGLVGTAACGGRRGCGGFGGLRRSATMRRHAGHAAASAHAVATDPAHADLRHLPRAEPDAREQAGEA